MPEGQPGRLAGLAASPDRASASAWEGRTQRWKPRPAAALPTMPRGSGAHEPCGLELHRGLELFNSGLLLPQPSPDPRAARGGRPPRHPRRTSRQRSVSTLDPVALLPCLRAQLGLKPRETRSSRGKLAPRASRHTGLAGLALASAAAQPSASLWWPHGAARKVVPSLARAKGPGAPAITSQAEPF